MNVDVANRLLQYRKKMGISQEELAAQIGVSRQAVSKWERAEASPDTDNLIELGRIYGVSLDELINGKKGAVADGNSKAEEEAQPAADRVDSDSKTKPSDAESDTENAEEKPKESVKIGFKGIHVRDEDGTKVDIDRNGIFVDEHGEQKIYTGEDGHIHERADVIAEHEAHQKLKKNFWMKVPVPIFAIAAYLAFGFFDVMGGWAFGWIVFLFIPVYYSFVEAVLKRDANIFAYPVFVAAVYLICGFMWNLWHPLWLLFLTIPLYYWIVGMFKNSK